MSKGDYAFLFVGCLIVVSLLVNWLAGFSWIPRGIVDWIAIVGVGTTVYLLYRSRR